MVWRNASDYYPTSHADCKSSQIKNRALGWLPDRISSQSKMSLRRMSRALHPLGLATSSNCWPYLGRAYLVAGLVQMLVLEHFRRLCYLATSLAISFAWKRTTALSCQSWLHSIVGRSWSWWWTSWIWSGFLLLSKDCTFHYASSFQARNKALMLDLLQSVWI